MQSTGSYVAEATISGLTPLIMNSDRAMIPQPMVTERENINKKKGKASDSEKARRDIIDVQLALYLRDGRPYIPARVFRATVENGARKYREGAAVRGGLAVLDGDFVYDEDRYGDGSDLEKLVTAVRFTTPVKQGQSRILRSRAMFETPWSATFRMEAFESEVDFVRLRVWIETAGRVIGIGDWRPQNSGIYGRFELISLEKV